MRLAADAHRSQTRKGTDIPYITHPCAVAMILLRAGFNDDQLLAAALLHDVVEDTDFTKDELRTQFPPRVCELVAAMTERKLDSQGQKRPWRIRKQEHLEHLRYASSEILALALADKLHNLSTIQFDLSTGVNVWGRFNAPRDELLGYYRAVAELVDLDSTDDSRVLQLADEVRRLLDAIVKSH